MQALYTEKYHSKYKFTELSLMNTDTDEKRKSGLQVLDGNK